MSIFACSCSQKPGPVQGPIDTREPTVEIEQDTVPKVRNVLSIRHQDLLATARAVSLKGRHAVVVFKADTKFPTDRNEALDLFRAVRNIKDG